VRRLLTPTPKTPQDYRSRAEACQRLADTAICEETREIMRDLASRWRVLAGEAEAKTQHRPTKPLSPPT
jgi:hypothetical protein